MIKFWFNSIFKVDSIYKSNFNNTQEISSINKVVFTMYLDSIVTSPKTVLYLITSTNIIASQTPTPFKANKSVSSLNLRKNMILGTKATLRKSVAFDFLDFFIPIVLANDKENKLYKLNDGGCLLIRLENLFSFPQINMLYDAFPKNIKVDVNIVLNGKKNKGQGTLLYTALSIPLEKLKYNLTIVAK